MKHGDISNRVNISIGIMCLDTLVTYRDNTFTDRVLNKIMGKSKRAEVDETVRSTMEYIYRNTEYTVDLLIPEEEYNVLKPLIADMPYNRVVLYSKISQISSRLLTGDLSYVVDNNAERRSTINSIYAIPLSELSPLIKRRAFR